MSWITENKGRGPWEVEPITDKVIYNEGDRISSISNPVWDVNHEFSGVPVTGKHVPCGYWSKGPSGGGGYVPPPTPPASLVFSILMAYINNSPCYEAGSGGQHWEFGIVPSTKLYSDGVLSDGYDLPIIEGDLDGTWCCMFDTLPDGRLVIANDLSIYLETAYQSGVFNVAATIPISSEASFLKVSPDGAKIAFGIGYTDSPPLTVFDVSLLDTDNPPQLFTDDGEGNYTPISGVSLFNVNYYDAIWWNDQYLLINYGTSWGSQESFVDVLNISTGAGSLIIDAPLGNSGGMCLDNHNNLITGIGYTDPSDYTGDIYAYKAADIQALIDGGDSISYSAGTFLCKSLSAGHMVVDHNDYLFVGGGDWISVFGGTPDPDVIGHVEKFQLLYDEEGNVSVGTMEKLYPDSCEDDSAAGPLCKIPKL